MDLGIVFANDYHAAVELDGVDVGYVGEVRVEGEVVGRGVEMECARESMGMGF